MTDVGKSRLGTTWGRHSRPGVRYVFCTVLCLCAWLCIAAPLGWGTTAAAPAKLVKVRARIRIDTDPNQGKTSALALRGIFFTPSTISVGTVIMIVSNTDTDDHWFEINGVKTGVIREGGRVSIKVTFKHPGIYPVAISNEDLGNVGPGQLKVVK